VKSLRQIQVATKQFRILSKERWQDPPKPVLRPAGCSDTNGAQKIGGLLKFGHKWGQIFRTPAEYSDIDGGSDGGLPEFGHQVAGRPSRVTSHIYPIYNIA
jgi:hypothetical protein